MSLYAKRLEHGRFLWPSPATPAPAKAGGVVAISTAQLAYMLDGIDWKNPVRTWRPSGGGVRACPWSDPGLRPFNSPFG